VIASACRTRPSPSNRSRVRYESDHPHDRTIPIVLAGGRVRSASLPTGVSLLDVPATVLWAFGAPVPPSFGGRPLTEAFTDSAHAAYAGASNLAPFDPALIPVAAA
jgi:hypothetical protein